MAEMIFDTRSAKNGWNRSARQRGNRVPMKKYIILMLAAVMLLIGSVQLMTDQKQENITIDDSDKEALAKRYGYESLETMLQNDNIDQKMVDDTALMQKTLDFLVENAKITVSTEENNAALNTEAAEDEAK